MIGSAAALVLEKFIYMYYNIYEKKTLLVFLIEKNIYKIFCIKHAMFNMGIAACDREYNKFSIHQLGSLVDISFCFSF
jgi:hypothetical protein